MKHLTHLFYFLLFSTFLFVGCKKEDDYGELTSLADDKIQQAVKLTENLSCNDLKECRIDTLYYTYVPVHPSFEQAYNKLIAEAADLKETAQKVYKGPIVYNTSPAENYLPPHFGIRCIAGKVKVASARDLELPEINQRLDELLPKMTTFFNDIPCTDPSKWHIAPFRKDCEFISILYTDKENFAEFGNMAEQYNHLDHAKRVLDKSLNCPDKNDKPAKGVVFENGKPKITY
ncbi:MULTISPECIES: hypothetical protein [Sphingobacterium]|uniref:hypothetical protein n=1 Tax=Sphingobacterium TaxID=28453 RepID=UPI0008A2DDCC|nr:MULTISPECIES: hypothetical protein [Sphingobacterium]OFV12014.1 hypothetical protein HMPREF3127_17460 [Sphingobacterium sp. HMSC13C05]HCX55640.1 hypothetical protein [Sphingobacterium sp.]